MRIHGSFRVLATSSNDLCPPLPLRREVQARSVAKPLQVPHARHRGWQAPSRWRTTGPRDAPGLSREAPCMRLCYGRPDQASAESGSGRAQLSPRNLECATWSPVRLGPGGERAARPACHLLPGLSPGWFNVASVGGRPEAFARRRRELGSALDARSGLFARARA